MERAGGTTARTDTGAQFLDDHSAGSMPATPVTLPGIPRDADDRRSLPRPASAITSSLFDALIQDRNADAEAPSLS